ncbi:MAG: EAL domain-containing protein [Gammaproteobacteria bacterium]|nr:EAL domain-containing protein [Gammaproteobacteria bacterium]
MTLRGKLLLGFVATALGVTLFFGLITFQIASDHAAIEERHLLEDLAKNNATWVAAALQNVPVAQALGTPHQDVADKERLLTALINAAGDIVASTGVSATELSEFGEPVVRAALQQASNGSFIAEHEHYLWGLAPVPNTSYRLLILHHAEEEKISFANFGVRMVVVGAIVIWFAVWASLIISGIISRRLEAKNALLVYQTLHDDLTHLPNRRLLYDRLAQAILVARRQRKSVALIVFDLNRFKDINDTLGHQAGDQLLEQIGPRLRKLLRQSDTVARLGGDDFAILLPEAGIEDAHLCTDKILKAFNAPFEMKGMSLRSSISIGIACFPQTSDDPDTLIRQAEVALYHAKATNMDRADYSRELDPNSVERLTLQSDMQKSLERNQLVYHYQPKIDVKTRQIKGVEALVRWVHPERGMVQPADFIPMAEQSGFIRALTYWGVEEALSQWRAWHQQKMSINIAINISARSLRDPHFIDIVTNSIKLSGVNPNCLEFELTESAVMLEPERSRSVLQEFRALGVALSVDDFGTGFTSLSYLKDLPIDKVKIDRSFVTNIQHNVRDAVLVRSIIDLAHNMGYMVVAEGVEDEKTWNLLEEMGCDIIQGFYVTRPMSASSFEEWLRRSPWKLADAPPSF